MSRRLASNAGFMRMMRSRQDTWPIVGCISAGLGFMLYMSASAFEDNSVRIWPSQRSDPEFYFKQNPEYQKWRSLPDQGTPTHTQVQE